jgi:signal transduction protein with GAF and PtsI domain
MLADLGISAPKSISYNSSGRMILPADYPHSEELRQGLKDNPALERALRTVNALTSHYVELQKLVPFHEEYAAAETQAQIDAVLDKYRHLLNDSRSNSRIALHFSHDGRLELTADGKSVEVA